MTIALNFTGWAIRMLRVHIDGVFTRHPFNEILRYGFAFGHCTCQQDLYLRATRTLKPVVISVLLRWESIQHMRQRHNSRVEREHKPSEIQWIDCCWSSLPWIIPLGLKQVADTQEFFVSVDFPLKGAQCLQGLCWIGLGWTALTRVVGNAPGSTPTMPDLCIKPACDAGGGPERLSCLCAWLTSSSHQNFEWIGLPEIVFVSATLLSIHVCTITQQIPAWTSEQPWWSYQNEITRKNTVAPVWLAGVLLAKTGRVFARVLWLERTAAIRCAQLHQIPRPVISLLRAALCGRTADQRIRLVSCISSCLESRLPALQAEYDNMLGTSS